MSQTDPNISKQLKNKLESLGLNAETLYDKCKAMANNLWWSWHPEIINIFRDLDPDLWRKLDHNPIALLRTYENDQDKFYDRVFELTMEGRINYAFRRLKQYMTDRPIWAKTNIGVLGARPVAYFSLEFGIHESVPIYSGGLGVLAGDHVKSASGMGVPLIAVGLFYDEGYFKQHLDSNGNQQEEYINTKIEDLPMQQVLDKDGKPLRIRIETRDGAIFARVWKIQVGRVELYLLDTDVEENEMCNRKLTSRLYGGTNEDRIRQELIVGVGGVRALRAVGINPGVYHLNEGHCAFATLEVMRDYIHEDGMSFDEAQHTVNRQTCFTTHTPVPAGHDRFNQQLMEKYLEPMSRSLGISIDQLMALGRVHPEDHNETFCMTVLGMKMARYVNGVSNLHGVVSRRMWKDLWPDRDENSAPIGHITNGVHLPSWLAGPLWNLYNRTFVPDWYDQMYLYEVWSDIYKVEPGELWETHQLLKNQLIEFVRRRVTRQCVRRNESEFSVKAAQNVLDPNALLIGFARRFATYKRATLFMDDLDWMRKICSNPEKPVQFVFAGKAHPADEPGKALIKKIAELRKDPVLGKNIVFVEDYDINVARHLVQGVDVWMNNPRRPLEASGTSGQKAVLNGVLNFSVLDGWWAEAYNGVNGFAIGNGRAHRTDDRITDSRDAASLRQTLENEIIPLFYDRDEDGVPLAWVERMMNSIASLAWRFSAHRMVVDYVTKCYLPAAGNVTCDMNRR